MKDSLVRFGVAMESSLIEQLDTLAELRGCNRSELLRDLTRAEVSRTALAKGVPAFAAVTLVYNHHVRELSERLITTPEKAAPEVFDPTFAEGSTIKGRYRLEELWTYK